MSRPVCIPGMRHVTDEEARALTEMACTAHGRRLFGAWFQDATPEKGWCPHQLALIMEHLAKPIRIAQFN